jgi:hypothetical protein
MIQYFGPEYDLVARAGWHRLKFEKCGRRGTTAIVTPNIEVVTGMKVLVATIIKLACLSMRLHAVTTSSMLSGDAWASRPTKRRPLKRGRS